MGDLDEMAGALLCLIALSVAVVDGACLGAGPCPPKPDPEKAYNKSAIPEYGVAAHTDTCAAITSLDGECGNQTVGNSCGRCEGPNGLVSCVSGNRKGPDDASICCVLWKYDGFSFDYGGECKNERGSSNFTFNHGSHAHYMGQWDPTKGCKQFAYQVSVDVRSVFATTSGSTKERREATASHVRDLCMKKAINHAGEPSSKLCDKVKSVILTDGVTAAYDLTRFCMSIKAEKRENVSRSMYDIHPWPKEAKTTCKINCGPYGTRRTDGNCSCDCLGNWGGDTCRTCMLSGKEDCGDEKAVQRMETRFCKCVCKMPYWLDVETGKCSRLVNMTSIVEYAPAQNLKNAMDVNQEVWAPYVEKKDGGKELNMSDVKTADISPGKRRLLSSRQ